MDHDPCDWSFTTDSRSVAEESWSRMLSDNHLQWSLDELAWDSPVFSASVRRRALADLVLVDCECGSSAGHRGNEEMAATDDAYLVLLMTLEGSEVVEQADQQCLLAPGSVVVWDSESEAAFAVKGRLRKRSLILPKSALADVGIRGRLRTGRVLDHHAPAVRLLASYLDSVSRSIDEMPLGAIPAVRNATIELVSAALQVDPAQAPANAMTVAASAQRHIDANLRDPQLTPTSVAAASGVSLRTLQRAFADSDLSVAEIIRTRRLAAARDDLLAGASIASVARRWQFSDTSHFSRAFKRHFGVSPGGLSRTRI